MPENAATHRRYSGINVLILWAAVIETLTCRCAKGVQWENILHMEGLMAEKKAA